MKNVAKLFGIIALVSVIVFSMASCASSGGGSSDSGGPRGTDAWPDDIWNAYNLSGLQQPSGTETGVDVFEFESKGRPYVIITLYGGGKADFDDLVSQVEGINGWMVEKRKRLRTGESVQFYNDNTEQAVAIGFVYKDGTIKIYIGFGLS